MPRRLLTALLCFALLALGACGRTDDTKVRRAVDQFINAKANGDFAQACELYTSDFRDQQGLGDNCPEKLKAQVGSEPKPTKTEIAAIKIHDNQARVDLDVSLGSAAPSRVTLGLIDKDGHWRIAAST